MKKERYAVTGMTCSACSAHVQKAVAAVPGVHSVQVNLLQNNMTVEFEEAETTPETIFAAVKKLVTGLHRFPNPERLLLQLVEHRLFPLMRNETG